MGAPRQTRADAWKRRPVVLRYRKFKDRLRLACGRPPVPLRLSLVFYLAMPDSWSAKKKARMAGTPHQSKPDIDNIAKGVMDALWPDGDAEVADLRARKFWSDAGSVCIDFTPAEHADEYHPTTQIIRKK
jgi:Holliday junction resolvase RusA-like endonuclease